ncbi:hypothetical protein GCM10007049_17980 [Echinicola pacifica]|uniref:DUF4249 domain-containing protein n=1 Tax=Echinicola pacifica TaxID=346377 RepID=A0A918PY42_9BACT|nr:DUF4249 domain-containing protein [Echinicola pacifica]GGZ25819.1 hypothetical protein GCM10007049_17980 [Echinicola pacifica]
MRTYWILTIVSALLLFSCEEVIELDLDNADPEIVIEGTLTDQAGPYTVKLSESVGFYDDNVFPAVSGAVVRISDDNGYANLLEEVEPGIYQTSDLQGQRGSTYRLEVEANGAFYTAVSEMPELAVPIDSISFRYEEESLFYKEGYYFRAYFTDPEGLGDYYRFTVLVNGEVYVFDFDGDLIEDDNLWLADDKYTDGNSQDYDFPHTLKPGDVVSLQLHHLNEDTFDYYRTLVDVIDGGGVAPSNPLSNFGDTALGYFGAFSVTEMERTVVPTN